MANTLAQRGHVAVSLVVQLFPKRAQGVVEFLISIFGFILFGLISWQSVVYALDCQRVGEVSLTLQLPFYPFIYGVAIGAGVVCLVLLVDLIEAVAKMRQG